MMSDYKKITVFENRNRTKLLVKFRENVVSYFNIPKENEIDLEKNINLGEYETEKAKRLRKKINMNLDTIHSLIILSRIKPVLYYSPHPYAIDGFAGDVDLIINIFNLYNFQIEPQQVIDFMDRAIGIYEKDRLKALFRTINPFFWIGLILDYINKIDTSGIGKIIKSVIEYLEKFRSLIK